MNDDTNGRRDAVATFHEAAGKEPRASQGDELYREVFDCSPVAIWVEHWRRAALRQPQQSTR